MFPDFLIPTTPPPWYTIVAIGTVILLILGAWIALARLIWRTGMSLLALPWVALSGLWSLVFGRPLVSHGTAAWCTKRQLWATGVCGEGDGIPLAQTVDGEPIQEVRGRHCVMFGPPRSGKSRRVLMPLLRTTRSSVVVSDLRNELHRETHEARAALGPVFRFSPGEETSDGLNPLDLVRWGTAHAWADVDRQVHHLVAPEPGALFDGPAVTLLVAIALYCHSQDAGSWPGVLRWMQEPARSLREKMETLRSDANPDVAAGGRTLADYSERMRMGIWGRALEALRVFWDPLVAQHTRHSAVDLRDLQHGRQPVSLYLNVDFADVTRLGPLLGLIVDSLVATGGGPQPIAPRHHVLMVLDELANLGRLPGLASAVSHLQGSGVQIVAAFQNLSQVYQVFGQESPILSSFGTALHYRPSSTDWITASYVANLTGQATVMAPNVNTGVAVTWGWGSASTTVSVGRGRSATGRPLLLPDEVLRLGDDTALVFLEGLPPIAGRKLGFPPVSRLVQAGWWANAHRETAAGLAVAALLVLALHPLWSLHLGLTPRPQPVVGQAGVIPIAARPTLPATSEEANPHPRTEADASALWPAVAQTPAPPPDLPWRLMMINTEVPSGDRPFLREHYADEPSCQKALDRPWRAMAKIWAHEQKLGQKGVVVWERDGKLHWERRITKDKPLDHLVINEAWCEKD